MLKTPITFCNFFFIWFTSFQRKCNQKQKKDNSIQIVNSPFLVKIKRSKLVIFKLPLSFRFFNSLIVTIGVVIFFFKSFFVTILIFLHDFIDVPIEVRNNGFYSVKRVLCKANIYVKFFKIVL